MTTVPVADTGHDPIEEPVTLAELVRCPVTFARVGCSRLACDYSGHGQAQTYKRLWTPH